MLLKAGFAFSVILCAGKLVVWCSVGIFVELGECCAIEVSVVWNALSIKFFVGSQYRFSVGSHDHIETSGKRQKVLSSRCIGALWVRPIVVHFYFLKKGLAHRGVRAFVESGPIVHASR
jgi:hypothetical protein